MSQARLTTDDSETSAQVVDAILEQLVRFTPRKSIIASLVKEGIPKEQAVELVEIVSRAFKDYRSSPEGREFMARSYARRMLYGILWTAGGAVVTALSYSAAASSPSGGVYIVTWGAMFFGIVGFFTGLFGWLSCRI